jgi:hypothetical protein
MAAAMTVALSAQDTTVKSRTDVKADDATVVSLTGCLQKNSVGGRYTLVGSMAAAGESVTTKTKVKTDVDDDDVEVTATTRSKANDVAVGTSGRTATYVLLPREGLALTPHIGHRVQISAIMLDPGEDDSNVKIDDRTTVDPDEAPETTRRTRTKIEVDGARHGEYTAVSVKALTGTCPSR